jgi:hypothetical protein
MMLELGESPKTVQTMLAHSRVSITLDTYSNVQERQRVGSHGGRKIAEMIDRRRVEGKDLVRCRSALVLMQECLANGSMTCAAPRFVIWYALVYPSGSPCPYPAITPGASSTATTSSMKMTYGKASCGPKRTSQRTKIGSFPRSAHSGHKGE